MRGLFFYYLSFRQFRLGWVGNWVALQVQGTVGTGPTGLGPSVASKKSLFLQNKGGKVNMQLEENRLLKFSLYTYFTTA